jgi:hypothetical protein
MAFLSTSQPYSILIQMLQNNRQEYVANELRDECNHRPQHLLAACTNEDGN